MARPTLNGHPKFAHLSGIVGGRGPARGYLELIWDAAYACGDPVIGDARKVEAVADWRGARGELVEALVDSGFLDAVQMDANGKHLQTYAVHDLEHHAPDYVLKRWQREAERKAKGETVRSIRQRAAAQRWKQTDANGEHEHTNVRPHAPAPAPARDLSPSACDPTAAEQEAAASVAIMEAVASMAEDESGVVYGPPISSPRLARTPDYFAAATSADFHRVLAVYPRKDAEKRAAVAFQAEAARHPGGEKGLADEILAALPALLRRSPYNGPNSTRPFLETVLVETRWRDRPSAPDDPPAPKASGPPRQTGPTYSRLSRESSR